VSHAQNQRFKAAFVGVGLKKVAARSGARATLPSQKCVRFQRFVRLHAASVRRADAGAQTPIPLAPLGMSIRPRGTFFLTRFLFAPYPS